MDIEFIDFARIFGEEKSIGIATVRVDRRWVFRYRISRGKDGQGWFVSPPSLKDPNSPAGKDYYLDGFMPDSRMEDEQLKRFIREHVQVAMQKEGNASVFDASMGQMSSPQSQPMQAVSNQANYANYAQPAQPVQPSLPFIQRPQYAQPAVDDGQIPF